MYCAVTLSFRSQTNMTRLLAILLLTAPFCGIYAQKTGARTIAAVKTILPIKIDGELNEEAWKTAPVANNLVEQRPTFGKAEAAANRSEFYILYDDNAVYFGGFCHEQSRDSISTELVGRDQIGINDFAGIIFDTYRDQINGVGFYVTALGEQYDAKYALNNEDESWSTVYQTATKVRKDGWTFEMRIPYSALRFSKEKVQSWGVNFLRRRTKTGQQYFWNPVDPNKFGLMNQSGLWEGISDIRSPVRLSFSPYFSSYLNHTPDGKWDQSVNGGMDVKYGISKGFTLDMTLIPDFGQVQSDNQVLNLSPFEVRYNENRSFFTEGTELFNKGNLFYSRRIGGTPLHYNDISDTTSRFAHMDANDVLLKNPSETKLVNATKISGRTAGGLGIGFFNAITKPQYATVERDNEGHYKLETNPLTNYNIIVLDQTMKNNSSVTLVNTNVTRNGSDYDANVTAGLWDLYDKKVNYNFWGKVANSRLMGYTAPGKTLSGYNYELNFGKFRGPFNYEVHQYLADARYEQNDLGYFTNNNYIERGFTTWYKITKPRSFYNNFFFNFNGNYTEQFRPRAYQSVNFNLNANTQLKNLWVVGMNSNLRPEEHDFYEARSNGRMFKRPGSWMTGIFINTNTAKKYTSSFSIYYRSANQYHGHFTEMNLANQYRFSDRLSVGLSNYLLFGHGNPGFAFDDTTSNEIVFGLRQQRTVENILNVKYNFNIKMGITFRARHYWSKVHYTQFFDLKNDGGLEDAATATENPDDNVNFFNIDMIYTWEFAPGSFINIAWKDAAQLYDQDIINPYYHNLTRTFRTPQQNNFSVKIIYYLDYLALKKHHVSNAINK
jgi:hypothetical protein